MPTRNTWLSFCLLTMSCAPAAVESQPECPAPPAVEDSLPSACECQTAEQTVPEAPQDDFPFADHPNNRDVNFLNRRLDALNPGWARNAVSLAVNAVGYGAAGIRSVDAEYFDGEGKPAGEGTTNATVTIIVDVLDDSVKQSRWRFRLVKDESERWRYADVETEWTCWPGRGAQQFTKVLCH